MVNDLPVASTALNESTDVSAVALSDSTLSVTLAEYGNAVISTPACGLVRSLTLTKL